MFYVNSYDEAQIRNLDAALAKVHEVYFAP
jgi:hypothetical protein